jgi:hypothetical protein
MPIQPRAPSARLNSALGVVHEAKRSSLCIVGSVSFRKARTSPRSASASGGRRKGGNSSLRIVIALPLYLSSQTSSKRQLL